MFAEPLTTTLRNHLFRPPEVSAEEHCRFWTRLDGLVCVQHVRLKASAVYRPHSHSEYGIVTCLRGEVGKTQLGATTVVGPGETAMSNSGIEHASAYLAGPGGCEAVCLTVEPRGLGPLLVPFGLPAFGEGSGPVFRGKFHSPTLHECAAGLAGELSAREVGHTIVVEGMASRLLIEALRGWPRSQVDRAPMEATGRLPRRDFVRAYEFMRWCRKDEFRLRTLCHFLGTSEERFARLFFGATGSTPAHFYNALLIDRSRELLRDGSIPVKAVGYELGFKTSSHFIASFKRQSGLTPLEFRRQVLGD